MPISSLSALVRGTAAAEFDNRITTKVKKERSRQLRTLVEQSGRVERQRFIGTTRPVLWEGEGQSLTDEPGALWSGLTDNYLRVMTVVPEEVDLQNRITPTAIDSLTDDILFGTVIDRHPY